MKKKQLLIVLAIAMAGVSCKKNVLQTDTGLSKPDNLQTASTTTNFFGAIINAVGGHTFTGAEKTALIKDSLKCAFARMNIVLTGFSGSASQYDLFTNAGLKVILNVSDSTTSGAHHFPTDTAAYKILLKNVLDVYQPEVLVIENEETTTGYHIGPITDYFNELKAAINVAHSHVPRVKVTNGGIVARAMTLLTWKAYIDSGLVNKASSYASRAFPADRLINGKPDTTITGYKTLLDKGMQMIAMYKSLPLDYVNFHWYEPIYMLGNASEQVGLDTVSHINSQALGETIRSLRNKTGKAVLTNEIGQYNMQPGITTDIMDKLRLMNMPYAIWYSGDGSTGGAVALQNANSSLRVTGTAFKNYIQTRYP